MKRALALLMLLGFLSHGSAASAVVVLREHALEYATMPSSQGFASSLSQLFTDIGGREVLTAFSVDAGLNESLRIQAVRVDFVVGRRPIPAANMTSTTPMTFLWDSPKILGRDLRIQLRIYADCNGTGPCGSALRSIIMEATGNASNIYLFKSLVWGYIYRADYVLHLAAPLFTDFECSAAVRNCSRHWIVLVGRLAHRNVTAGFEYSFRLPIGSEANRSQPSLMLSDATHLMNASWVGWQDGNAIRTEYYNNINSPQVGFEVAGQRYQAAELSSPSALTVLVPEPSSAPRIEEPSVPSATNNGTESQSPQQQLEVHPPTPRLDDNTIIIIAGVGWVFVFLICIPVTIWYIIKRTRRWQNDRLERHQAMLINLDENDIDVEGTTYHARDYATSNPGVLPPIDGPTIAERMSSFFLKLTNGKGDSSSSGNDTEMARILPTTANLQPNKTSARSSILLESNEDSSSFE